VTGLSDFMTDTARAASSAPASFRRVAARLFGRPGDLAISLACVALVVWIVPPLLRWAVLDAVWSGDADACRVDGAGACWAFIATKARFIVFGFYPPDEQVFPAVASLLIVGLVTASWIPRLWGKTLFFAWVVVPVLFVAIMRGRGVLSDSWSGLPLTLMLTTLGVAGAFPFAVLLALGRRSRMGIVRLLSVGFIELVRGVPMIAVLYVATLLIPLMLPKGDAIDKLARVQVAVTLFTAAYMAEIIRAGLQAIPKGQAEAAAALGLSRGGVVRLVVLPQALRVSVPAMVNLAVGVFHDTTLVAVVGSLDILNTARTAAHDTVWLGFYDEAFVTTGFFFLVVSWIASRRAQSLERSLVIGFR